jgi:hypothetical protein
MNEKNIKYIYPESFLRLKPNDIVEERIWQAMRKSGFNPYNWDSVTKD